VRNAFSLAAVLPLLALASGCQPRARPWEQGDAGLPAEATSASASPNVPSWVTADGDGGPDSPDATGGDLAPRDGGEAHHEEPSEAGASMPAVTPPVRVGGPWVRCYGNFHPSGEPVKDVTRLTLLCGPENGMHRLTKQTIVGAVEASGRPVTETFEARRGECYRVFAVAEPSVEDLDITVQSSRGVTVAADHSEDNWPIVQPDRPLCPLSDDRYTVEISARKGRGRIAAEVWSLRSPGGGNTALRGADRP
jgi:hypothetical protein